MGRPRDGRTHGKNDERNPLLYVQNELRCIHSADPNQRSSCTWLTPSSNPSPQSTSPPSIHNLADDTSSAGLATCKATISFTYVHFPYNRAGHWHFDRRQLHVFPRLKPVVELLGILEGKFLSSKAKTWKQSPFLRCHSPIERCQLLSIRQETRIRTTLNLRSTIRCQQSEH